MLHGPQGHPKPNNHQEGTPRGGAKFELGHGQDPPAQDSTEGDEAEKDWGGVKEEEADKEGTEELPEAIINI